MEAFGSTPQLVTSSFVDDLLPTSSMSAVEPQADCQMCFAVDYDSDSCPLPPSRYVCGNESSIRQLQCLVPFNLEKEGYFYGSYGVFVYGVVTPAIVLVTLVTNVLVVAVLCRPNMRTPTNVILANMAVADMLTGLWPLPPFLHFYSLGNYDELVPYSWCFTYGLFAELLPMTFHTASIWLTVALATQRYIYVCHPFKAKTWCTMRNAIIGISAIYAAALLTVAPRYFDTVYLPVVAPSVRQPAVAMETCVKQFTCTVYGHVNVYFPVTFVFRVFAVHLLPCVWLVVINALLVVTMRRAQERRSQLLKQRRQSEGSGCRQQDNNKTTYMLIVVVGLFLVVELPLSVSLLILTLQEMFGSIIQSSETSSLMSLFLNLVILLSYPLNFFIYCAMSSQFRDTFRAMFSSSSSPYGGVVGSGAAGSLRSSSTLRRTPSRSAGPAGGGTGGGAGAQYVCLHDSDTPLVGGRFGSKTDDVTLV